ncbi:MAG TPA: hypothetical protein VFM70_11550 [Salinimicrobium sp.]|nr:hypothetical protein [Salinimicrobium sp.]
MAKLYTNPSPEKKVTLNPRKETISFLLNYSKALKITRFGSLKFKSILN